MISTIALAIYWVFILAIWSLIIWSFKGQKKIRFGEEAFYRTLEKMVSQPAYREIAKKAFKQGSSGYSYSSAKKNVKNALTVAYPKGYKGNNTLVKNAMSEWSKDVKKSMKTSSIMFYYHEAKRKGIADTMKSRDATEDMKTLLSKTLYSSELLVEVMKFHLGKEIDEKSILNEDYSISYKASSVRSELSEKWGL
jgi:hypothetical protein